MGKWRDVSVAGLLDNLRDARFHVITDLNSAGATIQCPCKTKTLFLTRADLQDKDYVLNRMKVQLGCETCHALAVLAL